MILFFIGIIEMLIVTIWTKFVTKTQVIASGIITVINVLIWYYVLETIVNNISDWKVAVLYAIGCAVGTMLCTYYFQVQESKSAELSKTDDLSNR